MKDAPDYLLLLILNLENLTKKQCIIFWSNHILSPPIIKNFFFIVVKKSISNFYQ